MSEIIITDTRILGNVIAMKWVEEDIHKIYIPSLEISSYGNTKEEALEMIQFSLKEFVLDLKSMGLNKIKSVLIKLKWEDHDGGFLYSDKDKNEAILNLGLDDSGLIEEEILLIG